MALYPLDLDILLSHSNIRSTVIGRTHEVMYGHSLAMAGNEAEPGLGATKSAEKMNCWSVDTDVRVLAVVERTCC